MSSFWSAWMAAVNALPMSSGCTSDIPYFTHLTLWQVYVPELVMFLFLLLKKFSFSTRGTWYEIGEIRCWSLAPDDMQ